MTTPDPLRVALEAVIDEACRLVSENRAIYPRVLGERLTEFAQSHAALAGVAGGDVRNDVIEECLAVVDRYGFASVFKDGRGGGQTLRQALMKLKDKPAPRPAERERGE